MLLVYSEHFARKQHMLTWCRQARIGGGGVGAVPSFASGESPPALSRPSLLFILGVAKLAPPVPRPSKLPGTAPGGGCSCRRVDTSHGAV